MTAAVALMLFQQNCSLAVVGEGEELQIFDNEEVAPYLEGLDQEERRGGAREAAAPEEGEAGDEAADPAAPAPPAEVSNTLLWAEHSSQGLEEPSYGQFHNLLYFQLLLGT